MMQVQFLETILVDDHKYIDRILIDGKEYTFLMHKIAEPNVFGVLKQEEGNTVSTIAG